MSEGKILVAVTSAVVQMEEKLAWIIRGRTTVREGHPILQGRDHMFRPLVVDFDTPGDAPEQQETDPAGKQPTDPGKQETPPGTPPGARTVKTGAEAK
jgi:hypothetical protein